MICVFAAWMSVGVVVSGDVSWGQLDLTKFQAALTGFTLERCPNPQN